MARPQALLVLAALAIVSLVLVLRNAALAPDARTPRAQSDGMQAIPGIQTTYKILKEGAGAAVSKGNTVTVHALGQLHGDPPKKFWSTKDAGQQPFTYQAGVGGVITGWDQGCLGMKVGEVRNLIIPAAEGYGAAGFPAWGITPNATLNFEIEVLKIN